MLSIFKDTNSSYFLKNSMERVEVDLYFILDAYLNISLIICIYSTRRWLSNFDEIKTVVV